MEVPTVSLGINSWYTITCQPRFLVPILPSLPPGVTLQYYPGSRGGIVPGVGIGEYSVPGCLDTYTQLSPIYPLPSTILYLVYREYRYLGTPWVTQEEYWVQQVQQGRYRCVYRATTLSYSLYCTTYTLLYPYIPYSPGGSPPSIGTVVGKVGYYQQVVYRQVSWIYQYQADSTVCMVQRHLGGHLITYHTNYTHYYPYYPTIPLLPTDRYYPQGYGYQGGFLKECRVQEVQGTRVQGSLYCRYKPLHTLLYTPVPSILTLGAPAPSLLLDTGILPIEGQVCTSSTSSIGSVLDSRYKYMEVLVRPGHYPGTLHYHWILLPFHQ